MLAIYTGCSKTHCTIFNSRYKYPKQLLFKKLVKVKKIIVFGIENLKIKYGLFFSSYKGKSSN